MSCKPSYGTPLPGLLVFADLALDYGLNYSVQYFLCFCFASDSNILLLRNPKFGSPFPIHNRFRAHSSSCRFAAASVSWEIMADS